QAALYQLDQSGQVVRNLQGHPVLTEYGTKLVNAMDMLQQSGVTNQQVQLQLAQQLVGAPPAPQQAPATAGAPPQQAFQQAPPAMPARDPLAQQFLTGAIQQAMQQPGYAGAHIPGNE